MGKVYAPPKGITPPSFRLERDDYNKACNKYEKDIQDWCRLHGSGTQAGKLVRFQVADGYAVYAVVSLKPLKLIHLDHIDGYQQPYIERLTAKDIQDRIKSEEAFTKMFKKKNGTPA